LQTSARRSLMSLVAPVTYFPLSPSRAGGVQFSRPLTPIPVNVRGVGEKARKVSLSGESDSAGGALPATRTPGVRAKPNRGNRGGESVA